MFVALNVTTEHTEITEFIPFRRFSVLSVVYFPESTAEPPRTTHRNTNSRHPEALLLRGRCVNNFVLRGYVYWMKQKDSIKHLTDLSAI